MIDNHAVYVLAGTALGSIASFAGVFFQTSASDKRERLERDRRRIEHVYRRLSEIDALAQSILEKAIRNEAFVFSTHTHEAQLTVDQMHKEIDAGIELLNDIGTTQSLYMPQFSQIQSEIHLHFGGFQLYCTELASAKTAMLPNIKRRRAQDSYNGFFELRKLYQKQLRDHIAP